MQNVTVSDKGQVVIPASIRRSLGIRPGVQLGFEVDGAVIRVSVQQAVVASDVASGYGMLKAKRTNKKRDLMAFDIAAAMRTAAK
jgi:antitoxin PrlF